jgi:hypothetical protein|tara:strand:- start:2463 stop:2789 length:327 start_codon:yes stop_codon:yes gene_type:complete
MTRQDKTELTLIHEASEEDNYSQIKMSRTYKADGQLFRISISTHDSGKYTIDRFSENGGWEWIEAEGGSFTGKIHIDKNNIGSILMRLEQSILTYSAITKPYREDETQ